MSDQPTQRGSIFSRLGDTSSRSIPSEHRFSTTDALAKPTKSNSLCTRFITKQGCHFGSSCRYIHETGHTGRQNGASAISARIGEDRGARDVNVRTDTSRGNTEPTDVTRRSSSASSVPSKHTGTLPSQGTPEYRGKGNGIATTSSSSGRKETTEEGWVRSASQSHHLEKGSIDVPRRNSTSTLSYSDDLSKPRKGISTREYRPEPRSTKRSRTPEQREDIDRTAKHRRVIDRVPPEKSISVISSTRISSHSSDTSRYHDRLPSTGRLGTGADKPPRISSVKKEYDNKSMAAKVRPGESSTVFDRASSFSNSNTNPARYSSSSRPSSFSSRGGSSRGSSSRGRGGSFASSSRGVEDAGHSGDSRKNKPFFTSRSGRGGGGGSTSKDTHSDPGSRKVNSAHSTVFSRANERGSMEAKLRAATNANNADQPHSIVGTVNSATGQLSDPGNTPSSTQHHATTGDPNISDLVGFDQDGPDDPSWHQGDGDTWAELATEELPPDEDSVRFLSPYTPAGILRRLNVPLELAGPELFQRVRSLVAVG